MLDETKKILEHHSNRIMSALPTRNVSLLAQEYLELLDVKLDRTAKTIETRAMQEQTRAQLDAIKMKHVKDVTEETNQDGKPVFSNDKKRQVEVEARLMNDKDFASTRQEFEETAVLINEYAATIDVTSKLVKLIESTIQSIK